MEGRKKNKSATKMTKQGEAEVSCSVREGEACCENSKKQQKLYAEMKEQMDKVNKELQEFKEVKKITESHTKQIEEIAQEQVNAKFKRDLLTNVVIKHDETLLDVKDNLTQVQKRSMRYNVIISGLEEQPNESIETLRWNVQKFIMEKLQIQEHVDIDIVHRFGSAPKNGHRPVVIKVATHDQKEMLIASGPKLREKDSNGRFVPQKYFVSEQLPDILQEKKRYNQFWVRDNKRKPSHLQQEVNINHGKLYFNNQLYRRKLNPPQNAELLRLDNEELDLVKQVPLFKGGSHEEKNSEFIGYAAKVKTVEEVRMGYRKLKIKFADATHIVSAYRLKQAVGPLNQEGCDDGEHGASRFLLQMLMDGDYTDICVYVVRYYGGTNIGPQRFDIITNLAKTAIKKMIGQQASRPQTRSVSRQRPPAPNSDAESQDDDEAMYVMAPDDQRKMDEFITRKSVFKPLPQMDQQLFSPGVLGAQKDPS